MDEDLVLNVTGLNQVVCLTFHSIDHMSQTMRHAVEAGTKIQEELLLKQEDFLMNNVSSMTL